MIHIFISGFILWVVFLLIPPKKASAVWHSGTH